MRSRRRLRTKTPGRLADLCVYGANAFYRTLATFGLHEALDRANNLRFRLRGRYCGDEFHGNPDSARHAVSARVTFRRSSGAGIPNWTRRGGVGGPAAETANSDRRGYPTSRADRNNSGWGGPWSASNRATLRRHLPSERSRCFFRCRLRVLFAVTDRPE